MTNQKKNFVIQMLRRGTYKWHSRWRAEKRSKVGRNQYICECCGQVLTKKETQMDHVVPVVDPVRGFVGFDEYADRMYPDDPSGWQRLCKDICHKAKTDEENLLRKEHSKDYISNKKA